MKVSFDPDAWDDYLYWQKHDKSVARKLNALITECQRHPYEGTGKPEQLKANFSGYWSRRLTREHRLIYRVGKGMVYFVQCRFHY
ncbi:MAG: Txe/YoeB family addiction module toxin [Paracoccaceae bacterium]